MAITPTLKWNTTDLPEPVELSVEVSDLDSDGTGRNQSGYMFRDRVRGGATSPRKIQVKFGALSSAQTSTLLQAIGTTTGTLVYPDPYTGAMRSSTFYCGNRTAPVLDRNPADGAVRWKNITVNFIEC